MKIRIGGCAWFVSLGLVALTLTVAAQVAEDPIYMKIDGIDGDVTAAGHEKWIEVNSFQWAIGRPAPPPGGQGGTPSVSEIVVTKNLDSSSPLFMSTVCGGDRHTTVTMEFVAPVVTGGRPLPYLQWELENCFVTSWSTSSGGDRPTESLSLNFTKITFSYIKYDSQGKVIDTIVRTCDVTEFTRMAASEGFLKLR